MFRRLMALLCCMMLILTAGVCAAEEEAAFSMAGFDGISASHDWSTNGFFTRMQQQTGLTFTYSVYTDTAKWQAAKDAMFAEGGTLPDVLFKASLSTDELIRYTDSGKLIDLKPLLEENAPNLWALLQENPEWLETITLPNGKIGALPSINLGSSQACMWINKTWLERLGLEMPTDMESLRTVLTAFRDQDPNRNGKNDEVPWSFLGAWELKFFSHAWGVVADDYNVYRDEAGQIHYWPLEDSFTEFASTMRGFYQDGLLAKNGFNTSDTLRQISSDDDAEIYGLFIAPTPMTLVTYKMSSDYAMLTPLACNGTQVYRDMDTTLVKGTFAITSACSDPAALLRWVDYLYTEEGAVRAMAGDVNEGYEIREDGRWNYPDSISYSDLTAQSIYDTGYMPWLFPWSFYKNFEDDGIAAMSQELENFRSYLKVPNPKNDLYGEDRSRILALQDELGAYVDITLSRWILGEIEITDETIAAFRQGLQDRGVGDMITYWQQRAAD